MRITSIAGLCLVSLAIACASSFKQAGEQQWESKFVTVNKDGSLKYIPDEKGNTIPDFSHVGYYSGDKAIPDIAVVRTVSPGNAGNDEAVIQAAIDEVAKLPLDKNGFRGAVLLKKGTYRIPGSIRIQTTGIILRGEGNTENDTKIIALTNKHDALINVSGSGNIREIKDTRVKITDNYIPTGTNSFSVSSASAFKKGDKIIVNRPGTDAWIKDLQMDQIQDRGGTKQWTAAEYNLGFERVITAVNGNKISIDNPIVMPMETKYGGAEIYKYEFEGRISHVGIEQLYLESVYETDTSENHSWEGISFNKIENSWVRNVTAKYFASSCVNLSGQAKNISVLDSKCFDHKSVITGSRRYSFNNNGQLNLFMNCQTSDGRHDYVTGAKTLGPNVFVNCSSVKTHADIGPHHRWSAGTLYDNIVTDGEINVQDRGNWGSGHGWAGVTQVVWNCTVKKAAIQNPWVSGKNYSIGLKGEKYAGRLPGRPDGEWEGQNEKGLQPESLYMIQLKARKKSQKSVPVGNSSSSTTNPNQITLPAPSEAFKKSSKVIGWPEGKTPVAPEGFVVTKFADKANKLNNPRWMSVTPNGDILVSQSKTNKNTSPNNIILLRDTDKDGSIDITETFMSGLKQPLGMLILNKWLYVGNTDGIYRYPYTPGQLQVTDSGQKIVNLTPDGYNNHWTRNIIANKDGSKLYIATGSGSNVGERGMASEHRRACILEINPDGSGERMFADGIRNPVGMDWEPVTGALWTAVNERDNLGDDLVPDYVTSVKDGGFYGWPYAYFGATEDPRMKGQRPDLVAKTLVPDVPVGAHTASLGLAFYKMKAFPQKYRGGAFVGQHGSWNRSVFSGYKVLFIPFTNGKPGKPEDFLTGFIADESKNEVYGRPVGVTVLADGSLLVADDAANTIWKVSRK